MKELMEIQSKLNVPKTLRNNFGGYNYRSAELILEAVKPLLKENKCTLTINDDIVMVGDRIYIKAIATIRNESGETETTTAFAREALTKKGMDDSQVTGAASSYARKYALNGLFCIDDTKDADALNVNKEYTQPTDANLETVIANIRTASSVDELSRIWNECYAFQSNNAFVSALANRKKELKTT
ncbi:MAG: ERF family protein [Prevotella sp.]|nr:ERF family protein [Prevotella sp.]